MHPAVMDIQPTLNDIQGTKDMRMLIVHRLMVNDKFGDDWLVSTIIDFGLLDIIWVYS